MNKDRFALVIDDSVSIRNFVSAVLRLDERIGGRVIEAESPEEALRMLEGLDGKLDFIVSDWNMPGMPLPQFMAQIKQASQFASAPLFLLTGESETKVDNIAGKTGAQAVLRKPFTPEQLIALIMQHVPMMERRRAPRVVPLICCEVDLGFEQNSGSYSAAIINISESGLLLRSPLPERGVGHVYDMAALTVFADNCPPLKLLGEVVRIEAERGSGGHSVRIAFEFQQLDQASRDALRNFILLNNPTENSPNS